MDFDEFFRLSNEGFQFLKVEIPADLAKTIF